MKEVLVRQKYVILSFILLLTMNIGPLIAPQLITVPVQLLISSSACVFIGCSFASRVMKLKSGDIVKAKKGADEQTVTKQDALKFPITASIVLLSLYILHKVSPALVNGFITVQFCLLTVVSISNLIMPYIPFSQQYKKVIFSWKPPKWLKSALDFPDIQASKASLITNLICALPVLLYYVTKYWILNNIFGILFSIVAIRSMNLGSFYVGFLLLWLLFFYDIFWVYGTDVMVTVAKSLDIPIKLLFPYYNDLGQWKFSMLGLGDIVLPGVFVSICLKYDIDKSIKQKIKQIKDFKLTYFNLCFIGYILGIVQTYAALKIFNHAQPALLFLVPMCTLPVLLRSFIKGEYQQMKAYESDKKQEKTKQNQ